MTKFVLARPGAPWDYATLGFIATANGAILDGSLFTPVALTIPPDAYWSVYGGGSAETSITRYASASADALQPVPEIDDGWLLAYDATLNTGTYQDPADLIELGAWADPIAASYAPKALSYEDTYWKAKAALLDPAALYVRSGAFDFTTDRPYYMLNAYALLLGNGSGATATRFDYRTPPGVGLGYFVLPSGTRVRSGASGATSGFFAAIDPTAVTYAGRSRDLFYERMGRLPGLTWRTDPLNQGVSTVARLDTTRAHFDVGGIAAGRGVSSSQQEAQEFDFPIAVASSTVLPVEVFGQQYAAGAGDLILEVRADNAGAPTGALLGTATIARASLSAAVDWNAANITLTGALTADTKYWVLGKASTASFAFVWGTARGTDTTYYTGKESADSGATWAVLVGGEVRSLRIGHAAAPSLLIVNVVNFDNSWTTLQDDVNATGMNLWNEVNDTDPFRYSYDCMVPWQLQYGMRWAMQPSTANGMSTLMRAELPTDW